MILQALYEMASYEELVGDPDYELAPISYLVSVAEDGRRAHPVSTLHVPPSQEGKKKPRQVPRQFSMPREPGRTSGDRAFFLYDKAEYAFGLDPEGKRPAAKLARRFALFRERIAACAEATGDPAVRAVLRFLERLAAGEASFELPEDAASNALFTFRWHTDTEPITDRPAVREYWKGLRQEEAAGAAKRRCLVTGELGVPAEKHTVVKYVPGAQGGGVPFVSFNAPAFESYGWSGNENAVVSQDAAGVYAAGLARLLHPQPPHPADPSRSLEPWHYRISADTVVGYWSRHEIVGEFRPLVDPDPKEVAEAYHSVWKGKAPAVEDPDDFYALTLTGSQGRVISRGWFRTTVAELVENLARYFADLELLQLTPPPKKGGHPPAHSLRLLLTSLAPLGKSEQVPAALGQQIFEAALLGRPFPFSVLQRALLRERAEIGRDDWADLHRRDARRSLIKAVLERRRRTRPNLHPYPELRPTMDPHNNATGYVLGRLMAVIERVQEDALSKINTTVADQYFSAASATPRTVYPRMMRNSRNHLRTLREGKNPEYRKRYESLFDDLYGRLDPNEGGLPAHLDLEHQGLFILGYHHQRKDFFTKKADKEPAEPSSSTTSTDALGDVADAT